MVKKIAAYFIIFISLSLSGQSLSLSPSVRVLGNREKDIQMTQVDIDIKIIGSLAVTTYEIRLYNPNTMQMEGEFQFPLTEGQSISRFALDINGSMREGVVVDKTKGQEVFESIARRRVDPGLLEKTKGNNFRARIYPLPANGYRRLLISYEQELDLKKNVYTYTTPLNFFFEKENIDINLTIEVESGRKPNLIKTPSTGFDFGLDGKTYKASSHVKNWTRKDRMNKELAFTIPANKNNSTYIEKGNVSNKNIFFAKVYPKTSRAKKAQSKSISLFWDTSLSMDGRNIQKEMVLLDAYFKNNKNTEVTLFTFNISLGKPQQFSVKEGNWTELKQVLQNSAYDGATQLGCLDFRDITTERIILFSDCLNNFGESLPLLGSNPVYIVNSALISEDNMAKYIAKITGGIYLNLNQGSITDAVNILSKDTYRLIKIDYDSTKLEHLTVGAISDLSKGIGISGVLKSSKANLTLSFGTGNNIKEVKTIELDSSNIGNYDNILERVWAVKQIDELDLLYDKNRQKIEELGRKYNIVTRNTSLIVLEELSDYLQYNITPPDGKILDEYIKIVTEKREQDKKLKANKENTKIEKVRQLMNEREHWWNKKYPKTRPIYVRPLDDQYNQNIDVTIDDEFSRLHDDLYSIINTKLQENYIYRNIDNKTIITLNTSNISGSGLIPKRVLQKLSTIPNVDLDHTIDSARYYKIDALYKKIDSLNIVNNKLSKKKNIIWIEEVVGEDIYYSVDCAELREQKVILEDINSTPFFDLDQKINVKIKLNKWDPKEPYLEVLRDKTDGELYETYLNLREDYFDMPSFYLDVATLFGERGLTEEAFLILTNMAELKIDNYRILKVLAHRLMQLGYKEYAIRQFRAVKELRPEEPQSYRDLGLALAENKNYQEAIDNLYHIITNTWDSRFHSIELTALLEINNIIAKAEREGIQLDTSNIQDEFIENKPMDIRIVLNWDTDNSDIDLIVTEPFDESCSFRNKLTRIGGLLPVDMRRGYGPEEYLLREAVAGKYKIEASFFNTQQQTVTGPTTIYLDIFSKYSTKEEQKETIILRLLKEKDTIEIGEIEFKK